MGFLRRFLAGLGMMRSSGEVDARDREDRARALASNMPVEVRRRFSKSALIPLVDAGWHNGRRWKPEKLHEFLGAFDTVFPECAVKVLSEFGGLDVGLTGRMILFGRLHEDLFDTRKVAGAVIGESLFPIGYSNIFVDDGLAVLMDESGRVYVDGPTGHLPPRDYRLELRAKDIDTFIAGIFAEKGTREVRSWDYSYSQPDPGGNGEAIG